MLMQHMVSGRVVKMYRLGDPGLAQENLVTTRGRGRERIVSIPLQRPFKRVPSCVLEPSLCDQKAELAIFVKHISSNIKRFETTCRHDASCLRSELGIEHDSVPLVPRLATKPPHSNRSFCWQACKPGVALDNARPEGTSTIWGQELGANGGVQVESDQQAVIVLNP